MTLFSNILMKQMSELLQRRSCSKSKADCFFFSSVSCVKDTNKTFDSCVYFVCMYVNTIDIRGDLI